MTEKELPVTGRFTAVYLKKGLPLLDDIKFRNRLMAYVKHSLENFQVVEIAVQIEEKLGIGIDSSISRQSNSAIAKVKIMDFIKNEKIENILDAVTVIFVALGSSQLYRNAGYNYPEFKARTESEAWRSFVSTTFSEENLGYTLNLDAEVRYKQDEEFEKNRQATITSLGEKRYLTAKQLFEKSIEKLDSTKSDPKGAIRDIFEACETAYKIIFDSKIDTTDRLTKSAVLTRIKPLASELSKSKPNSKIVSDYVSDGFSDWVEAGHRYRHGQKTEELEQPPVELGILMIDLGTTYLRWLVSFDQKNRENKTNPNPKK